MSVDILNMTQYEANSQAIDVALPVLAIECPDEVGALDKILKTLYGSNINVNYTYLSFNRESGLPIMVMHTDDTKQVENILINKGYKCL